MGKSLFHNDNPITLELACGKGEYAVGLGQLHPQKTLLVLIKREIEFG
jgi:tRNA (guanine-N7-)-methyltransferase